MLKVLSPLLFFFLYLTCSGQQKILMLNGNELTIKSFTVKSEKISFTRMKGNKEKRGSVDRFRVFSITDTDQQERIIYEPDTGYDLTIEQMRIFIKGEQAAKLYYHKPSVVVGGIMAGAVGSYFTFYGLPVPLLYGTIAGRISPKVKLPIDAVYPEQKSEEFIQGYQRRARDIKTRHALISGLIGFAVSVTFFSLYEGNVKF